MTDQMHKLLFDFEHAKASFVACPTTELLKASIETRNTLVAAIEALEKEVQQLRNEHQTCSK